MIFEDSLQTQLEKQIAAISQPDTDISMSFLTHLAEAVVEIWQRLGAVSSNSLGYADAKNNFGEQTKDIDLFARNTLQEYIIAASIQPIALVTEEDVDIQYPANVRQILFVDPIDGSSHVEYHSNCGTFFSFAHPNKDHDNEYAPIISGYALYGYQLLLTLALGDRLIMMVYDQSNDTFCRLQNNYTIPHQGKIYSICDADSLNFPDSTHIYVRNLKRERYKSRYNGVLVADLHRIVIEGGIFLSPTLKTGKTKTKKYFEAIAISHIMQAGGGKSLYDYAIQEDILKNENKRELFSSTPLVFGSKKETADYHGLIHNE